MRFPAVFLAGLFLAFWPSQEHPTHAQSPDRPRVLVSSDIGGTDPDDFQSMVHLLLYADRLAIEGLVSSPYGPGRASHIHDVVNSYATDYPRLRARSSGYPAPDALHRLVSQGAVESGAPASGRSTDGSTAIVRAARRADSRPLWVLVWGGIDDLAQALFDAPDIESKLRVYFIGGPNKMWSVDAYDYIERAHPRLWMIEANSTYRGWFTGGDQAGDWSNSAFVARHVAGRGALGAFFASLLGGTIKMGDSPSVTYVLAATRDNPDAPGWGGRFVRVWDGRKTVFSRLTTAADTAEAFGVVEFALPLPEGTRLTATATMTVDGRIPAIGRRDGRVMRFRFSPRDAKVWPFVIASSVPALDGQAGQFTAVMPPPARVQRAAASHPFWWTDDQDPAAAEGVHAGARHVSRWRHEFLADFSQRLDVLGQPGR